MSWEKLLLPTQSAQTRSVATSGQRIVNMYVEQTPEGSKYPFTLYNFPGLVPWVDLGTASEVHAMHEMGGDVYAISNQKVFRIDSSVNINFVGNIPQSSIYLMADNGGQGSGGGGQIVTILDNGSGYIITQSGVTQISTANYPNAAGFPLASSVTFIDGYFVVTKKDSGQFFVSASYDATSWDALNFATAEEKADNLVAAFGFNSCLWLFGTSSIEVWADTGELNFPFQKIPSAPDTTRGCGARASIVAENNQLFWLGSDRVFYTNAGGFSPQRISTHAIEAEVQEYVTVADAIGFSYTFDGHKFYVVSFGQAARTLIYDITSNVWLHRESYQSSRWNIHAYAKYKDTISVFGDCINGKIYTMSADVYTENGQVFEKAIYTAPVWHNGSMLFFESIRLDIDSGVGNISDPASNPVVAMEYSNDGAKSFKNKVLRNIGKVGRYQDRIMWHGCGSARERIFRFTCSDPVPFRVTGLYYIVNDGIG